MRSVLIAIGIVFLAGCKTLGDTQGSTSSTPLRPTTAVETLPKTWTPSNQSIGNEGDIANYHALGYGLVDIPVLNQYFNDILGKIKSASNLKQAPGRVFITASDKPEAEASADGNIYIGMGLIRQIETEDEVIAILAHEFAHVAFGDHDSEVWSNYQKQIQSSYGISSKIQAIAKAGNQNANLGNKNVKNLQKLQWAIEVTDKFVHPAWKRSQEQRADRLAIDLIVRMKYSFARGTKSILEKFATLDTAETKLKEEDFNKAATTQLQSGDLNSFMQTAFGQVIETTSRSHDSVSVRITDALSYFETFYDDSPRPTPRTREWENAIAARSVKGVIDNYRLAEEALNSVKSNPQKALKLAKQAVSAPTQNHAYPLMALASAQLALGDQQGYARTISQVQSLKEPT